MHDEKLQKPSTNSCWRESMPAVKWKARPWRTLMHSFPKKRMS